MSSESQAKEDNIELSLPINPAYVSAARLTASSIANRIGFDADEIEDIKAAVSEACTFIIKNSSPNDKSFFKVTFAIYEATLGICLSCDQPFPAVDVAKEMGLLMIKALMDDIKLITDNPKFFSVKMMKNHKINAFA